MIWEANITIINIVVIFLVVFLFDGDSNLSLVHGCAYFQLWISVPRNHSDYKQIVFVWTSTTKDEPKPSLEDEFLRKATSGGDQHACGFIPLWAIWKTSMTTLYMFLVLRWDFKNICEQLYSTNTFTLAYSFLPQNWFLIQVRPLNFQEDDERLPNKMWVPPKKRIWQAMA